MRLGLWSCLRQLEGTCARWDELRMRLQHLALFRGIGFDACAVNLGRRMPSTRLAPDRLCRLPSDHHTVTVEVAPDFHLRFPNVAVRQNRFLRFVNLRKSEIHQRNQ
jgi:hypothetical protein